MLEYSYSKKGSGVAVCRHIFISTLVLQQSGRKSFKTARLIKVEIQRVADYFIADGILSEPRITIRDPIFNLRLKITKTPEQNSDEQLWWDHRITYSLSELCPKAWTELTLAVDRRRPEKT